MIVYMWDGWMLFDYDLTMDLFANTPTYYITRERHLNEIDESQNYKGSYFLTCIDKKCV